MRRYVLTGTPGAGKTSILRCLAELGYGVIEEAATAVIARRQAQGEDPVSQALAAELERITSEGIYERQVFFVRNLGFCEPTPARRITFQESLVFERIHEQSYRSLGYELIDIPAGDLAHRAAAVSSAITSRDHPGAGQRA